MSFGPHQKKRRLTNQPSNMEENIKNKVREIQSKYCGASVETKLYEVIKETEELQDAYNIAMKEINRLRKLLGYDSQTKPKTHTP